jgi:hypothetical protein
MLQPKSKKSYPEGPAGSYLPGLPASVVADQARTMKAAASNGPTYKILKKRSNISTRTPLKQKVIVEKGSYEKGKVEKYASKAAMAKHEKKENKSFEKKEMKKSPLKQVSALSGKKDKSTVAPKTVASGPAKRTPILMKKKC